MEMPPRLAALPALAVVICLVELPRLEVVLGPQRLVAMPYLVVRVTAQKGIII